MKFAITGITGLRNRGVEALVSPSIEQLKKHVDGADINVLTRTPDYDRLRLNKLNVNCVLDELSFTNPGRLDRIYGNYPKLFESKLKSGADAIMAASGVIASGGDVFSSDYGGLERHLRPLELALKSDVPIFFLAQSIGPFKSNLEIEAWKKVAERAKLITVREKISYDYLTKTLNHSPEQVVQTADPAFLLQPTPSERVNKLMDSYGIDRGQPKIAVSISQGITHFSGCDYEGHLAAWQNVIKGIVSEMGIQILLIPHVQATYASNDDRVAASNLLRNIDFHPRVKLAGLDHTASEFKGLIGACDMVIAERMHAAIAGLSSGVCTLPVGYSIKAEGIMNDLFGKEYVKENDLLISVQDFLDSEKAMTCVRKSWENRADVSHRLKERLPEIRGNSQKSFNLIVNSFKN